MAAGSSCDLLVDFRKRSIKVNPQDHSLSSHIKLSMSFLFKVGETTPHCTSWLHESVHYWISIWEIEVLPKIVYSQQTLPCAKSLWTSCWPVCKLITNLNLTTNWLCTCILSSKSIFVLISHSASGTTQAVSCRSVTHCWIPHFSLSCNGFSVRHHLCWLDSFM